MSISKFFKEAIAWRSGGGHAADHKVMLTPSVTMDGNGNVVSIVAPNGGNANAIGFGYTTPVPIPTAIASSYNFEGATFSILDNGNGPSYTYCSKTPEQIFDGRSTARSTPGVTYYVNAGTGNLSYNGLSQTYTSGINGPFLTLNQAVTAANAGGVPAKVIVAPGIFPRGSTFSGGGVYPTVDIAFCADGGRVVVGTFEQYAALSKDALYGFTNCYTWVIANISRVLDLTTTDRYGCHGTLQRVNSASLCNITPNSWYYSDNAPVPTTANSQTLANNTLFINRADGSAVTNVNTRIYRTQSDVLTLNTQVNIGLFDTGIGGGFDLEGGQSGVISTVGISTAQTIAANKFRVIVAKNCTFRYGGGIVTAGGAVNNTVPGTALDSFCGAAWFFNCDASRNTCDGFSSRNNHASDSVWKITVNCSANANGEYQFPAAATPGTPIVAPSNNGWTSHDNVYGADFSGRYDCNNGGTIRSINTTVSFFAGTYVKSDLGDLQWGGALTPTAYMVDNTATFYCFRTKADMPAGSIAYNSSSAGTTIYQRQVWPSVAYNQTVGTIPQVTTW